MTQNNIEVSDDFFNDALDFVRRFDLTFEECFAIKSKRAKCFIDLRMAYECILRAVIVYFEGDNDRESNINLIEKFKHYLANMEQRASKHFPDKFISKEYSEDFKNCLLG